MDQTERRTRVAASGLALRLDRVQPRPELRGGVSASSVGTGRDHALDRRFAVLGPAGGEGHVCEDRRSEKRVVGFPCRLQGTQEGFRGLLGLAEVEELNAAGQEIGLGECAGEGLASGVRRLGQESASQTGMLQDRGVKYGRRHGPVEVPMGTGNGLEVLAHRDRLPCDTRLRGDAG